MMERYQYSFKAARDGNKEGADGYPSYADDLPKKEMGMLLRSFCLSFKDVMSFCWEYEEKEDCLSAVFEGQVR